MRTLCTSRPTVGKDIMHTVFVRRIANSKQFSKYGWSDGIRFIISISKKIHKAYVHVWFIKAK